MLKTVLDKRVDRRVQRNDYKFRSSSFKKLKFSKWSIIIIFLYHMLYFGVCFGLSNPDLIMKSRGFMIAWISNVSPSVMSMNRYTFRTFKNYETSLFGHLRIMRHPSRNGIVTSVEIIARGSFKMSIQYIDFPVTTYSYFICFTYLMPTMNF